MATTEWEVKKLAAKKLFDRQLIEQFRSEHERISEDRKVLRIAATSPLPLEARAKLLSNKLEALVRRRVEQMPTYEVELMDSIINLLRYISGDHGDFITKLVAGYEQQIEYWSGHAKHRGEVIKMMGDTSSLEFIISRLMESNGHKGQIQG